MPVAWPTGVQLVFFNCSGFQEVIRRPGISIVGQLTKSVESSFFFFIGVIIMIYSYVLDDSLTSKRFTTRTEQLTKCCEPLQKMRVRLGPCKTGSVIQSIPTYFQNSEPPIICYKYNKPIRNTIFNFNKLVSDLDIHANTPKS